jgi:hypothetical protein
MRLRVIISVTFIFLGFIRADPHISFAQSDHEDSVAIWRLCASPGNPCGTAKREAAQIKLFSQKVIREKDQLKLTLESGSKLVLTNADLSSERRRIYRFITFFPQTGYFLVHVSSWEGFGYRMIHGSTGKITPVVGIPAISPDLKRFVATSLDLEAGYKPNRIQIYRFGTGGLEREWHKDFAGSGPSNASWVDPETIFYFENTSPDGGQTYKKKDRILKLGSDGWELVNGKQK